jgi:hypothetical protein
VAKIQSNDEPLDIVKTLHIDESVKPSLNTKVNNQASWFQGPPNCRPSPLTTRCHESYYWRNGGWFRVNPQNSWWRWSFKNTFE